MLASKPGGTPPEGDAPYGVGRVSLTLLRVCASLVANGLRKGPKFDDLLESSAEQRNQDRPIGLSLQFEA